MGSRWGNDGNSDRLYFLDSKITAGGYCSHEIKRCLLLARKTMTNLNSILKSRDITFPKFYLVKAMVFPGVMYGGELDCQESWPPKNWYFWLGVLEKTLENPLSCKEIKPANPKLNQSWILIGKTNSETEAPILWPPNAKTWLIGKDPDAGENWRQEEKGTTEDEMIGWLARRTWVWESSRSWWWTGKPDVLWSMGLQIVGHDWATEVTE